MHDRSEFGIPVQMVRLGVDTSRYQCPRDLEPLLRNTDDATCHLGLVAALEAGEDEVEGSEQQADDEPGEVEIVVWAAGG